jgi:putative addiction module killer protein
LHFVATRVQGRASGCQGGILGDVKPVGEGVVEMREFFGPGWRMYYVERAKKLAKEW